MPKVTAVVAENIRLERLRRRWSQEELGALMGLARATVGQIETGVRPLTLNEFPMACRALGVKASVLLVGADPDDLEPFI